MKILMVNDYKQEIGGAEVYMYSLKKELEQKGHTIEIFGTDISKKEYVASLSDMSLKRYIKRIWNFSIIKNFESIYNSFKPDVVHIHGIFGELSPSFLSVIKNTRTIMTIHDDRIAAAVSDQTLRTGKNCKTPLCPGCMNCVGLKGMAYERIRQAILATMLKKIDQFIVPGKFLYKRLKQYSSIQPLTQLYYGFDLPEQKPLLFKKQVLYIGRLTSDKGVEYLIKAFKIVCKADNTAHLTIVGNGDQEKELKGIVKKMKLSKNITFLPPVPHSVVKEYIYTADMLCIPSIYNDNLPLVCIEALGCGRPVITTTMGGLPEMVEDGVNGYLVPPKNAEEIADKILYLCKNKKTLVAMSQQAHKKSLLFCKKNHIQKILELYTK